MNRYNFVSERLYKKLDIVLKEIIQVVNFTKAKFFHNIIFGNDYMHLLAYDDDGDDYEKTVKEKYKHK
jgi:hypothetical protein